VEIHRSEGGNMLKIRRWDLLCLLFLPRQYREEALFITRITSASKEGSTPWIIFTFEISPFSLTLYLAFTNPVIPFSCAMTGYPIFSAINYK
jgi:hypothetical protein